MSEPIELIYNELVAEEKLKAGTKYEQLAAIVFKILNTEESVIHDLKLTGDGLETPHQIDVHVRRGDKELRWLVECRDFDANARSPKIGLGEVRDFASVVRDLMPDEAMMLTTVGFTSRAETYARERKIRLAILREFQDVSDWEGRFRELRVKGTLQGPSDLKITNWLVVDDEERRRVRPLLEAAGSWEEQRVTDTHSEYFLDSEGEPEATLAEVLDPIYLDIQKSLTPGVNTGTAMLDRTRHLRFGSVLVALRGFDWEVELFTWTHEWLPGWATALPSFCSGRSTAKSTRRSSRATLSPGKSAIRARSRSVGALTSGIPLGDSGRAKAWEATSSVAEATLYVANAEAQ